MRHSGHLLGNLARGPIAILVVGLLLNGPSLARAADDAAHLAKSLMERAGIQRGVCSVVTTDGGDWLPIELARSSGLFVHVRCGDGAAVERLRAAARDAKLGIDRIAVEQGPLDRLPYAENLVDVLIVRGWSVKDGAAPSREEMLRVLRPRGTAFIEGAVSELSSRDRQSGDRIELFTLDDQQWARFAKPPLKGAGDWSHWEHGPDNNPVSEDEVIRAPYLTQYLQHPSYIAMPSITTAAGGRTFLAIGHITHHEREWDWMFRLLASNGYNGTVLWERKLPEGYLVHRSAFIATDDAFYMIDGQRALVLDPETGRELREIRIPGLEGDWKWMVLKDGVLYALAGEPDAPAEPVKGDRAFGGWSWADLSEGYYSQPQVPWGFGHTLAAYDLSADKTLWVHKEDVPIDGRALAMGDDRIAVYSPGAHFRALDLKTGEVLWTTDDPEVLELIEQPGKGLTSTPGFRTMCMTLYTPDALIVQGQTRNNVVALSTADGYLLWSKQKVTNNPNAIYLDGTVILGVGERGDHVAVDPISGEVVKNLNFSKRACTRLTACSDSLFVRGEGTLRYDRESGRVLIDGAARPACNDGALPANGLLYVGPWQCDCNLSLIGRLARCSAGDFRFDYEATDDERLTRADSLEPASAEEVAPADWPTYRADNRRSSSTAAPAPTRVRGNWQYTPQFAGAPSAPTAAGGLVYVGGEDGLVKAIEADTGRVAWTFATNSPVKYPPTISAGRAYFGSGDGFAYCVDAATGRELWRFRAAPIERYIPLYGHLASTWPVNSGVLVQDGVAYFAAGLIDSDGTYVYAVDARTGQLRWQNNSSGHLNAELRKGVSVQGNLSLDGDRLLLAGGNQVSPAAFDIRTGQCLAKDFDQGHPKANNGRFVGLFADRFPIVGGRILYSAPENVSTKGNFQLDGGKHGLITVNFGGIPPAWDETAVALVNFQNGPLTCYDAEKFALRLEQGLGDVSQLPGERRMVALLDILESEGALKWSSVLGEPNKFEAVAMVVCPNAIVAAVQQQHKFRSQRQWFVAALDKQTGRELWRQELPSIPLPDGLLVDGNGKVVVCLTNGSVVCLAPVE